MSLAVVILSKNVNNLIPCLQAVERHDPGHKIIVVDDGLDMDPWPLLEREQPLDIIPGVKPFVFSRNANIGIRQAWDSGAHAVVLLNDDALLETPFGFTNMFAAQRAFSHYWLVSAACNNVGNVNQHPRKQPLPIRREKRTLAFVCVLIPLRTWDRIGALDERFVWYGWEDNDYCKRVIEDGGWLGIYDKCFVDHSKLHSTFRGEPGAAGDIGPGRRLYVEKWGSVA